MPERRTTVFHVSGGRHKGKVSSDRSHDQDAIHSIPDDAGRRDVVAKHHVSESEFGSGRKKRK